MVEGRSAEALEAFAQALVAHGGRTEQIELISMDMSPAYQSGASRFFPRAQIVFDRFHLMQMAGQALVRVRKEPARQGADLKGSLWRCVAMNGPVARSNASKEARCATATPNSDGQSARATCSRTSSPTKIKRPCAGSASGQSSVGLNLDLPALKPSPVTHST